MYDMWGKNRTVHAWLSAFNVSMINLQNVLQVWNDVRVYHSFSFLLTTKLWLWQDAGDSWQDTLVSASVQQWSFVLCNSLNIASLSQWQLNMCVVSRVKSDIWRPYWFLSDRFCTSVNSIWWHDDTQSSLTVHDPQFLSVNENILLK